MIKSIPGNGWILNNNEFYVRGLDGKEIAIYYSDTIKQWNVYGLDNAGKIVGLKRFYYMKDHLGSVRALLNEAGEVVSAQDYDAWGYMLEDRTFSSEESVYKFTGKERDEESEYDYFGARYYDGRIGRWGTIDPMLEKHFDYSPYNYVLNNPLIFFDPDGKQVFLGGDSYQESMSLGQYKSIFETQEISKSRYDNKRPRESGLTTTDVGLLDPVDWISGGITTLSIRLATKLTMSKSEILIEQAMKNLTKDISATTSELAIKKTSSEIDINKIGESFIDFLGEGSKKVINKSGDVIFISKDNLRKVRFDINKFHPHTFKHIDIETKVGIVKSKKLDWINIGKIKINDF